MRVQSISTIDNNPFITCSEGTNRNHILSVDYVQSTQISHNDRGISGCRSPIKSLIQVLFGVHMCAKLSRDTQEIYEC